MILTKDKLKQIIREALDEEDQTQLGKATASVSQVRSGALDAATAQGEQGITNQERGLIKQLSDMLVGGAEQTNLLSGSIITKIRQLAAELQKVLPQQTQEGAEDNGDSL